MAEQDETRAGTPAPTEPQAASLPAEPQAAPVPPATTDHSAYMPPSGDAAAAPTPPDGATPTLSPTSPADAAATPASSPTPPTTDASSSSLPPTPPAAVSATAPAARQQSIVHLIVPIVLMVLGIAGIVTSIVWTGQSTTTTSPSPQNGGGQFPGGFGGGYNRGNGQGGFPSGAFPSGFPTGSFPSGAPSGFQPGDGSSRQIPSDFPTGANRGNRQNGLPGNTTIGPTTTTLKHGWTSGAIAALAGSSVVFAGGLVYLLLALRRRTALPAGAAEAAPAPTVNATPRPQ